MGNHPWVRIPPLPPARSAPRRRPSSCHHARATRCSDNACTGCWTPRPPRLASGYTDRRACPQGARDTQAPQSRPPVGGLSPADHDRRATADAQPSAVRSRSSQLTLDTQQPSAATVAGPCCAGPNDMGEALNQRPQNASSWAWSLENSQTSTILPPSMRMRSTPGCLSLRPLASPANSSVIATQSPLAM
jgi:hypothetical protein